MQGYVGHGPTSAVLRYIWRLAFTCWQTYDYINILSNKSLQKNKKINSGGRGLISHELTRMSTNIRTGFVVEDLVPLWQSLEIINIADPPMAESLIIYHLKVGQADTFNFS